MARPIPVPTAETAPFWEGARTNALVLPQCASCGRIAPPTAPRCPSCLSADLTPFTCSGRASLRGRTVLHLSGLPGREPPLTIAECAVEEEPRVVLIALDPLDVTRALAPGAAVTLTFRAEENGWSYPEVSP
jgi:uncharacterized OB-fold protein